MNKSIFFNIPRHSENRIYITGMPQAGSTLCYNIVRLLIEYSGHYLEGHIQCRGHVYTKEGSKHPPYAIAKQHDLPPGSPLYEYKPSNVYVVNVKRDLRDAIASALRKRPDLEERSHPNWILEACERNIKWHASWKILTDYEWIYEKYKADPIQETTVLQRVLNFDLTPTQIEEIVLKAESLKSKIGNFGSIEERLNFEDMTRMDKTQITNKGIIGSYKESLSLEQIKLIENTHGDWLKEHGYMK